MTTIQTMDSREIAKLTGKNHAHVCRDIRNMLERLAGGESRFASSYLSAQNKPVTCYALPYRETMILISGYSVELRSKVIDREGNPWWVLRDVCEVLGLQAPIWLLEGLKKMSEVRLRPSRPAPPSV